MTRARNIAGFSTITTTPSPVHVGPIGVLTATRIDGEFNVVDIASRDITAQGIGVTNLQVSGITTGLNVSGIITAQNGINFNGTSTGFNASGVTTVADLSATTVSIAGTLTYEDVTNVDSVGVITARSGIAAPTSLLFKTGGSERFRINASGKVLINHDTARGVGGSQYRQLQIEGISAGDSGISIVRNGADASPPSLTLGKSRSGAVGGTTIVQDGDGLGAITFAGADGTNLQTNAAVIRAEVDGTPGENDMPGRLIFKTTADGAASSTERVRITSDGKVGINTITPVSYTHLTLPTNREV